LNKGQKAMAVAIAYPDAVTGISILVVPIWNHQKTSIKAGFRKPAKSYALRQN